MIKKYSVLETVVFEYDDMLFQGSIVELPNNLLDIYLSDEDEEIQESTDLIPCLYIRRKTTPPYKNTRIYTNNPDRLSEYSTRGFSLVYQIDKVIEAIIKRGWVIGADNLTMNDFSKCWSKLRLMKIDY